MFYGILLFVMFASVLMAITLFKITTTMSVKIAAYTLDFALVFGFACYFAHGLMASNFQVGNLIYLLDIAIGILAALTYGVLLVLIHHFLPRVSKVLNFFAVVLGVSVAFPLAIDFITTILKVIGVMDTTWSKLPIFVDNIKNIVAHNAIIVLLSIPVFIGRMKYLDKESFSTGGANEHRI